MRSTRCARRALRCTRFVACLAALFSFATSAAAQLPQTRLRALSPCGGKAGTTFDVKISDGADIDELTSLVFNSPDIKAVPKPQDVKGQKQPVANTFTVTIGPKVPSGLYEVRAAGKFGLSNPRTFVVGRLDEVPEKEPNNTLETATPVAVNKTVNAAISGGADVDYFKFEGKQGQSIVIDCRASRIDSLLDATLEVYDSSGRRLTFTRSGLRDDPVASLTLPSTGDYFVKVYDFTYGGGATYFYRLSIHAGPHIDFVLPPAGVAGTMSKFTLYGRNLPGGQPSDYTVAGQRLQKVDVQIKIPAKRSLEPAENLQPHEAGTDGFPYVLKTPSGDSNPVQIYFADAPVVTEKEPNDDGKQAQRVTLPVEIAGQFQKRGDIDTVTFQAKAGDVYVVEVFSQRLGTTADPYLRVEQVTKDKKGVETVRTLSNTDDSTASVTNSIFNTASDDPSYRLTVPADGTYRVSVRDRYFEARGDARLIYRLSIRKPTPDFRVAVLPITPNRQNNQPATAGVLALRKGENLLARVFAFRQDGFNGPIDVTVDGLPPGVVCKGTTIGPGQNDAYLVFSSDEKAAKWSGLIHVKATAKVDDPAKVKAVTTAQAQIAAAEKSLPTLRKTAQQAESAAKPVLQRLAQAKAAAAKAPKDKNLANKLAAAQKQAGTAQKKVDAAKAALAAGEKKLADAQAALKKAEAEKAAAIQTVNHPVRPATISWSPVRNSTAGKVRLARTLGLSVIDEAAPVQLTTDVFRVEANQGRQILLPVKLARREGFNKNVTIAVDGLPRNSNIQLQPKPINQGKDSELYRVFVNTNAKPGIYAFFLKGQAQVSYLKNKEKLPAAKKKQAEVAEKVKAAAAELKKATDQRNAAVKQATADANAVKQATTAQQAAAKKAADAKAAATKSPKDAKLKAAQVAAEKALTAANQALAAAKAKAAASEKLKAQAEATFKTADAKSKAIAAEKKAIDATVNTLSRQRPQNINLTPTSTPIIIEVRKAPATLSASVPGGGKLKAGGKLDIKVTVRRINNFNGPVTLSLPLPPGVQGLSAPEVTIPADKNDGTLTVQAAGNATTGQLQNMVVRAIMQYEGKAAVDAAITLNVSK